MSNSYTYCLLTPEFKLTVYFRSLVPTQCFRTDTPLGFVDGSICQIVGSDPPERSPGEEPIWRLYNVQPIFPNDRDLEITEKSKEYFYGEAVRILSPIVGSNLPTYKELVWKMGQV